jgi:hypothetical protein
VAVEGLGELGLMPGTEHLVVSSRAARLEGRWSEGKVEWID